MNEKKKINLDIKKITIIGSFVIALGIIGYVNIALSKRKNDIKEASTIISNEDENETVDVFSAYRDERSASRSQEISYIDSVVSSNETDEATKNKAQQQKLDLIDNMENELTIEGIIKTKLRSEAIVTVKNGAVNVVINKQSLNNDEVSQITEIIKTQTGEPSQNIKIMPQG